MKMQTEKKRVAVTLDEAVIQRLDNLAAVCGVSRSVIVTLALLNYKPVQPLPVISNKISDCVV